VPGVLVIAIRATVLDGTWTGTPGCCWADQGFDGLGAQVGDAANPDGNHKTPLRISETVVSKAVA
jgi:hypothetical protein